MHPHDRTKLRIEKNHQVKLGSNRFPLFAKAELFYKYAVPDNADCIVVNVSAYKRAMALLLKGVAPYTVPVTFDVTLSQGPWMHDTQVSFYIHLRQTTSLGRITIGYELEPEYFSRMVKRQGDWYTLRLEVTEANQLLRAAVLHYAQQLKNAQRFMWDNTFQPTANKLFQLVPLLS